MARLSEEIVMHCEIYFGVHQSLLMHVQKQRLLHSRCHNLFNNVVMALDKSFESSKGLMM